MRSNRRFTLHGILAILLAGIPAGAGLAATIQGPVPQPMSGVTEPAGLSFYQYLVDLGAVRPSDEVFARFGFVNTGTQPVTIQDIIPSCGCLKPSLPRGIKTFPPGKSGYFPVRIQTANERPGHHEYTIRVKYTDPQPREEVLTFRVKLPDNQVSIEPKALIVHQLNGQPTTSEVFITDKRDQPLEIHSLVTSTSLVSAELGEKSIDKNGHQRYSVKVTVAGKVPNRTVNAEVLLSTNDSTYRFLKIPLMIKGPGSVTKVTSLPPGEMQSH